MSETIKKQIGVEMRNEVSKIFKDKCFFCNMDLKNEKSKGKRHFHHFIPEFCEGQTNTSNLVLCCWDCHAKIHKKTHGTYGEIRQIFYTILCSALRILPRQVGWDDDLYFLGLDYEKNSKNMDQDLKKLYLALKRFDYEVGLMDNKLKTKDVLELGGMEENQLFGELNWEKMNLILKSMKLGTFVQQNQSSPHIKE